nr:transient receptor potential cation channel subfamily A member 1 homolog isoform X1 [Ciona intestinalis]|eukprot:XP_018667617.1 transient receptor potential cation channel subfamily A member 1 homolog isoform X1 [Ciona intestinalis]
METKDSFVLETRDVTGDNMTSHNTNNSNRYLFKKKHSRRFHKSVIQATADKLCQFVRDEDMLNIKLYLDSLPNQDKLCAINQPNQNDKLSALHIAVRYSDVTVTELLLGHGSDINIVGEDGKRPIHFAAKFYKVGMRERQSQKLKSCLEVLLEHGADVNSTDVYEATALHYACDKGHAVAVQLLLKCKDIQLEVKDIRGSTPLHEAAQHGHLNVVELLLLHGNKSMLMMKDRSGNTPLIMACRNGYCEVAEALLKVAGVAGDDGRLLRLLDRDHELNTPLHCTVESGDLKTFLLILETWDQEVQLIEGNSRKYYLTENSNYVGLARGDGNTCLHLAAMIGRLDMMQLILSRDTNINQRNDQLATPLYLSAQPNFLECVEYLLTIPDCDCELSNIQNISPLMIACKEGNYEIVQCLINHKANVVKRGFKDQHCLHLAVKHGRLKVVELLLGHHEREQLLTDCDKEGNTALHLVAEQGRLDIFKIVIAAYSKFNMRNDNEETPLHVASYNGHYDIIHEIVMRDRATLNDQDAKSQSPLHLAALRGHLKAIKELLRMGACARDIDGRGWTALDVCVNESWVDCATILLQNDPSLLQNKTRLFESPLHIGCRKGCKEMVGLLLSWGADVSSRLLDGRNPLDVAIDNQCEDCARLLIEHASWEKSLSNVTLSAAGQMSTPFRRLIKHLPAVAEAVLTKCMKKDNLRSDNPNYEITFDYKFLDDAFEVGRWSGGKDLIKQEKNTNSSSNKKVDFFLEQYDIYDNYHRLKKGVVPYSDSAADVSKDHPLTLMVESKRESLLQHPTVTSLLNYKWKKFGRYLYGLNLASYIVYLVLLNVYMTTTPPRFAINITGTESGIEQGQSCIRIIEQAQDVWGNTCQNADGARYITIALIIAFSAVQLAKEMLQILHQRLKYFLDLSNYMELALYSLSILVFVDSDPLASDTGIREKWQWECGAFAVLLSWMNLLLYVRRSLSLGIYVFMVASVTLSFLKFAAILILFLLGFSFSFYVLMQNQYEFYTPITAIVKTFVMMIGEMDYSTVFLSHFTTTDYNSVLQYSTSSYFVFVIFVVVMSLLVTNLLVGLAVDDIASVQEQATLKRLALQASGILDMEYAVPFFLRRRWVIRINRIYPNKLRNQPAFIRWFLTVGTETQKMTPKEKSETEKLSEDVKELKELIMKLNLDLQKMSANSQQAGTAL